MRTLVLKSESRNQKLEVRSQISLTSGVSDCRSPRDFIGLPGSDRWPDSNRARNRTPLGTGRTCPRLGGDDCGSRPPCRADNTDSVSGGLLAAGGLLLAFPGAVFGVTGPLAGKLPFLEFTCQLVVALRRVDVDFNVIFL